MRLVDWPRQPFLSDELRAWIKEHLATLGVEDLAVFAQEEPGNEDARRILVATDVGLVDERYGPRASTARFAIAGRVYPWQAVRGVDLRVETQRIWALEHRTRWGMSIARPRFQATTEDPQLGRALAEFAKAAVIMAEPSGWPPYVDDGEQPPSQPRRVPSGAPRVLSQPLTQPSPVQRPGPDARAAEPGPRRPSDQQRTQQGQQSTTDTAAHTEPASSANGDNPPAASTEATATRPASHPQS